MLDADVLREVLNGVGSAGNTELRYFLVWRDIEVRTGKQRRVQSGPLAAAADDARYRGQVT